MNNIYVVRGTEQAGPFTEADIRAQLVSGTLTGDSMVWWDGLPEWTALSKTPLASPAPATIAPVLPTATSAPVPFAATPVDSLTPLVPKTSALAIVSLVSAIVGLLCGFGAIVAVVTGHMARREIRRNPSMSGDGLALAGLIIGYIEIALIIIFLVFYFAFVGAAISQGIKNAQVSGMITPLTNNAPASPSP